MEKRQKLERLTGHTAEQVVRKGTGGEHAAVVLQTREGERVILQRIGGNPFDDPATRALVGCDVEVEGFRIGDVFRFRKAEAR